MRKMPAVKRLPVSIPLALHREFKVRCAAEGLIMSEVIRGLLEKEMSRVAKNKGTAQRAEVTA